MLCSFDCLNSISEAHTLSLTHSCGSFICHFHSFGAIYFSLEALCSRAQQSACTPWLTFATSSMDHLPTNMAITTSGRSILARFLIRGQELYVFILSGRNQIISKFLRGTYISFSCHSVSRRNLHSWHPVLQELLR